MDLVNWAEIAKLLGVSPQRVQYLALYNDDFPPGLAGTELRERSQIEEWKAEWQKRGRRLIGPRRTSQDP